MLIADWNDAAAYQHLRDYDGAAWAWEFLRRNPQYQQQWQAFIATWDALEASYGSPPNRDFSAWKQDPRAWLSADECAGDCRVDGDKVLIECALGAAWGFHKFPPSPQDERAVLEHRLGWREQSSAPLAWSPEQPPLDALTQIALRFDLDLPLRPQLERARRELQLSQRFRIRARGMQMRTLRGLAGQLIDQLRVLDGLLAGVSSDQLSQVFGADTQTRAIACRDGGYLALIELPSGGSGQSR